MVLPRSMKLFAVVILLSWPTVSSLRPVVGPPPGVLVRISERGIQYAAKKIMEWVDLKIDPGMRFSDMKGTFKPAIGKIDYVMTDIKAKNFNWYDLSGDIVPGVGFRISFHRISVTISGNFKLNYTAAITGTTSNSGTFTLGLSDVSLYVNATVGMGDGGLPTVDFPGCSASIGNIDLDFKFERFNWAAGYFKENIKSAIKPTLIDGIRKAVRNGPNLMMPEIANNIKPCLDKSCYFLIDLRFTSPPVFGKGFVETAHQGQIFWKSDSSQAPFKAQPFEHLPPSLKMADLYVNTYVMNTLLYAVYQNDLLSYEFTKEDIPPEFRFLVNTSCQSFCIGTIFKDVFGPYPAQTVELDAVATKVPVLNVYDNNAYSVSFAGNVTIQIRNSAGIVTTLGVLTLDGSVVGSALINSEGRVVFIVNQILFASASISDKEGKGGNNDVTDMLRSAATNNLLPKLNEFGQNGFSILSIGKMSANRASLKMIQNAFVLMTDVIYG